MTDGIEDIYNPRIFLGRYSGQFLEGKPVFHLRTLTRAHTVAQTPWDVTGEHVRADVVCICIDPENAYDMSIFHTPDVELKKMLGCSQEEPTMHDYETMQRILDERERDREANAALYRAVEAAGGPLAFNRAVEERMGRPRLEEE